VSSASAAGTATSGTSQWCRSGAFRGRPRSPSLAGAALWTPWSDPAGPWSALLGAGLIERRDAGLGRGPGDQTREQPASGGPGRRDEATRGRGGFSRPPLRRVSTSRLRATGWMLPAAGGRPWPSRAGRPRCRRSARRTRPRPRRRRSDRSRETVRPVPQKTIRPVPRKTIRPIPRTAIRPIPRTAIRPVPQRRGPAGPPETGSDRFTARRSDRSTGRRSGRSSAGGGFGRRTTRGSIYFWE